MSMSGNPLNRCRTETALYLIVTMFLLVSIMLHHVVLWTPLDMILVICVSISSSKGEAELSAGASFTKVQTGTKFTGRAQLYCHQQCLCVFDERVVGIVRYS